MPPTTRHLTARLVLGPALRAQSDRRLVDLVREGNESAFEEIVRRYRRPLDRFAASIVGAHADDVTQDSFRKALEALRHAEADVELRPWLFRIVRNTALNDLRDRPPAAAELAEDLVAGGRSAAAEAEQRAELQELTAQLRALPENQRAALVMRELEGMSHEEIAAALGVSDGAARQAIARGRAAIRSGFGSLIPLPLLRAVMNGGDRFGGAAAGGGAAGAGSGAIAAGGGSLGAGALKVGLATVVVAGTLGAGVAIDRHGGGSTADRPTGVGSAPHAGRGTGAPAASTPSSPSTAIGSGDGSSGGGHDARDTRGASRHHGDQAEGGDGGSRLVSVAQPATPVAPESGGDTEQGSGPGPSRHAVDSHEGSGAGGSNEVHRSPGDGGAQISTGDDGGHDNSGDSSGSSGGGDAGHGTFGGASGTSSGSSGSDDGSDGPGGGNVEATSTSGFDDGGSSTSGGDAWTSGDDGGPAPTESSTPTDSLSGPVGETVPPGGSEPSP